MLGSTKRSNGSLPTWNSPQIERPVHAKNWVAPFYPSKESALFIQKLSCQLLPLNEYGMVMIL
jgi:hypothetical protein